MLESRKLDLQSTVHVILEYIGQSLLNYCQAIPPTKLLQTYNNDIANFSRDQCVT